MKVQGANALADRKVAYLSGPMAAAQYGQQSTTMNLEMSSALARQQSSEQSNQYLTNLLKGVGKVGDTDWSSVIAGLSKRQKSATPKLAGGAAGDTQDMIWNPETGTFDLPDINLT